MREGLRSNARRSSLAIDRRRQLPDHRRSRRLRIGCRRPSGATRRPSFGPGRPQRSLAVGAGGGGRAAAARRGGDDLPGGYRRSRTDPARHRRGSAPHGAAARHHARRHGAGRCADRAPDRGADVEGHGAEDHGRLEPACTDGRCSTGFLRSVLVDRPDHRQSRDRPTMSPATRSWMRSPITAGHAVFLP